MHRVECSVREELLESSLLLETRPDLKNRVLKGSGRP